MRTCVYNVKKFKNNTLVNGFPVYIFRRDDSSQLRCRLNRAGSFIKRSQQPNYFLLKYLDRIILLEFD